MESGYLIPGSQGVLIRIGESGVIGGPIAAAKHHCNLPSGVKNHVHAASRHGWLSKNQIPVWRLRNQWAGKRENQEEAKQDRNNRHDCREFSVTIR
jgi:hypothetical protein